MKIENSKKIYAVACGMVAAGYDLYTSFVGDIYSFAQDAAKLPIDEDVRKWFEKAKTGQVTVNPYWPRGHAAISATFFIEGDYFDIDGFMAFFDSTGVTDPTSRDDLRDWLNELPHKLNYMEVKSAGLWERYCKLVNWFTSGYEPVIEEASRIAADFFGENAKELVFAPNLLFSPYATDFVHIGEKIIVIGHSCDVESMLHEALHIEIAKYRDRINAFVMTHWHGDFVNTTQMQERGYMDKDYKDVEDYKSAYVRVIEECFARGISTMLAGGGAKRLSAHANEGFGGVLAIGYAFERLQPKSCHLGEFIDHVLKEFA